MDVKEGECREKGEVRSAKKGLRYVGEQRSAKEDHGGMKDGRQENGEEEGQQEGLLEKKRCQQEQAWSIEVDSKELEQRCLLQ